MSIKEAEKLLEKYKLGTLNAVEKQLLDQWYVKLAAESNLNLEEEELERNLAQVWNDITAVTDPKPKKTFVWTRLAIAGVVLLVAGLSLFLYRVKTNEITQQVQAENIKPGGNRATLTLANGDIITLDNAANGKLVEQSGIIVTKTKDGQLIYSLKDRQGAEPTFNTIATPKGGQYQVHLPDGSKVWLNAESSLKYPTFFTGKERRVTLTGEAYFEVAKTLENRNIPFVVLADKQTITVLGTHFNVNVYRDEDIHKTTLLEGSVKVSHLIKDYGKTVVLNPGEQSNIGKQGLNVTTVNAEEAIAWKNGVFLFKDADIKNVMKSIARWYDVEVEYEGQMPNRQFSGEIHRNLNLQQVFEILSFYKVHFRTEGKTIIVTP